MTDFFSLQDKVAVVTGAHQGIGLAIVERFAAAGATVVIGDLQDCSKQAERFGGRYRATDVAEASQMQDLMEAAVDTYGRLDIAVNNAGVSAGYLSMAETPLRDFDFCYRVNTLGVINGIKAAAPLMSAGGSIVNVASLAATRGVPYLASYVASKWPVVGLTQTAAIELGPRNIRVNCVCPASVNTPMANEEGGEALLEMEKLAVPLGRIAEPDEVAAVVHFLASKAASYVNGQAINVCGGMSAGLSEAAFNKLAS